MLKNPFSLSLRALQQGVQTEYSVSQGVILVHDVKHQISFNYWINVPFEVAYALSHVQSEIIVCVCRRGEERKKSSIQHMIAIFL